MAEPLTMTDEGPPKIAGTGVTGDPAQHDRHDPHDQPHGQRHTADVRSHAEATLHRTRDLVEPVLRTAVDTLPGRLRTIAAYHLGWQDAEGVAIEADGGKLLRPGLVLAAAAATGGEPVADSAVLAAAAAVELTHNFTLLHDDVIDRDHTRRHRPTAWTVFGADNAILAGDAMLALALRLVGGEAASRLAECVIEICDGQYEDCAFEQRDDVTLEECMAMAGKKTGALLGCACALGALSVHADPLAVAALDLFGREIGMAFQLTDDLLGIWGDPALTGKPVGSDLRARKKSLPVVAALSASSAAAVELARLYALGRDFTEHELRHATDAVERAGGRAWAVTEATARVAKAHAHLRRAPGVDHTRVHDLRAIAELITRRTN
ncbi:geranylgeranyl diphosphate synthase type I [Catenulispora sp. GP43]|uniref:polyprenyl synthetase family protein n=1 Tax=Catenulispora sp. GP43 TaxID=3156263 RepID=UPI003517CBA7